MTGQRLEPFYEVTGIRVDPCDFAISVTALTIAAWEGDAEGTAKEVKSGISGVTFHCACGNMQRANLSDASPVSHAVEEFEQRLKTRDRVLGPKRLTSYERKKLRLVLINAIRDAANLDQNKQVCSKCGTTFSLLCPKKSS